MDDDQQFCLRWNNHQSTLVSVFDNLLENGTLVDCTLFAEGKFLKAHKVVLSACSPYFESLLTQQYDKHPIFILKDVKFQELKAMMDYMYRGEVNISQDQLAALLKAAESLQIKGLSDSRSKGESETRKPAPPPPAKTPPPAPTLPRVQGLTIEQRKTPKLSATNDVIEESRSREGSTSPLPRKRKKPRRRPSQEGVNDNHDASSSSESHSNQAAPAQNIPSTLPAVPLASTSKLTDVPEPIETKSDILTRQIKQSTLPQSSVSDSIPQVPMKEKLETHSELILEPKSEYIEEEMNEDSVEDLTLDDDDVSQMEQEMDHARPGPSHGSTDGSQGFGGWHMTGNQTQDEVFLAAQEAVGAHRDSQDGHQSSESPEIVTQPIPKINILSVNKINKILLDQIRSSSNQTGNDNKIPSPEKPNKETEKEINIMPYVILKKGALKSISSVKKIPENTYLIKCHTCHKNIDVLLFDEHVKKCIENETPDEQVTIKCEICENFIDTSKIQEHLKNCSKQKRKDDTSLVKTYSKKKKTLDLTKCQNCNLPVISSLIKEHLTKCPKPGSSKENTQNAPSEINKENSKTTETISKPNTNISEKPKKCINLIKCKKCNKFVRSLKLEEHTKTCSQPIMAKNDDKSQSKTSNIPNSIKCLNCNEYYNILTHDEHLRICKNNNIINVDEPIDVDNIQNIKNTNNLDFNKCNNCHDYFQTQKLAEHIKTCKSKIVIYDCSDCDFKSKSMEETLVHILKIHKKKN